MALDRGITATRLAVSLGVLLLLAACTAAPTNDEVRIAESYADALGEALATPPPPLPLPSRGTVMRISAPDGVDSVEVLDADGSGLADDSGATTWVGVDAAVAMTFTGRADPVCLLVAATSTGEARAAVAPYIALDDCTVQAQADLRGPFEGADQLHDWGETP